MTDVRVEGVVPASLPCGAKWTGGSRFGEGHNRFNRCSALACRHWNFSIRDVTNPIPQSQNNPRKVYIDSDTQQIRNFPHGISHGNPLFALNDSDVGNTPTPRFFLSGSINVIHTLCFPLLNSSDRRIPLATASSSRRISSTSVCLTKVRDTPETHRWHDPPLNNHSLRTETRQMSAESGLADSVAA